MDLDLARRSINAVVFFARTDPAVAAREGTGLSPEPFQVRIISVGDAVGVTTILDASQPALEETCFRAMPDELHFEKSAFEPFEAPTPSSGSARTIPSPPPEMDPPPLTERVPCSEDTFSDRIFSIDVVMSKR